MSIKDYLTSPLTIVSLSIGGLLATYLGFRYEYEGLSQDWGAGLEAWRAALSLHRKVAVFYLAGMALTVSAPLLALARYEKIERLTALSLISAIFLGAAISLTFPGFIRPL